jgi:hypothetical protein
VHDQSAIKMQCASQVNGVVPTQAVASCKLNSLIHDCPTHSHQYILISAVGRQVGARVVICFLGDEFTTELGGKSRGYLHQSYLGYGDRLRRAVTPRLNPSRAGLDQITFDQCATIKVSGNGVIKRLTHDLSRRSAMMSSLAGGPPALTGVRRTRVPAWAVSGAVIMPVERSAASTCALSAPRLVSAPSLAPLSTWDRPSSTISGKRSR